MVIRFWFDPGRIPWCSGGGIRLGAARTAWLFADTWDLGLTVAGRGHGSQWYVIQVEEAWIGVGETQ